MPNHDAEPFIFGIPLIAREACDDWALADRLLELTLRSVLAQVDEDFRVVLAGHDVPPCWATLADQRFTFIAADWPVVAPTAANDDGGAKKALIDAHVRSAGGGLLMYLDADDWVDRDLVRAARLGIGPGEVGGIVPHGHAYDWVSGRAAACPVGHGFDNPFIDLCGSTTVARIEPDSDVPVRRDPHAALGWHAGWERVAGELGVSLARLPVEGVYVVGTDRSHSERQGPHAAWRRDFAATVRTVGAPLAAAWWRRFGLEPADRERVG